MILLEKLNSVRNEYGYNYGIASSLSALGLSPAITPEGVKITGTISRNFTAFIVTYANNNTIGYLALTEDYVVKLFGTCNLSILVQWRDSNNTLHYDGLSSPKTIPSGSIIEGVYIQYQGTVSKSVNVDVQILICKKRYYDLGYTDYVPYALGNQVLTPALIQQVDEGAKNKGDFQFSGVNPDQSISPGTITYTVSNGQFTFNGSADTSKNYACYLLTKKTIEAGNYIISGCVGGSSTTYRMRVGTGSTDTFLFNVTTEPVKLNLTSDTIITVQFVVQANTSVSNLKISPMLCTEADWDVSHKYVPYRPNWDLVYSSLLCDAKYAKVPVSTSYSLIGSITTKANRLCRVTVTQEYASVPPTGLILSKSNQSSDFDTLTNRLAPPVETTTDDITLTISALCYYTYDRTVYIWAKAKTASTNGNNFMALCEHFGDINGVKNSMT